MEPFWEIFFELLNLIGGDLDQIWTFAFVKYVGSILCKGAG